MYNFGMVNNTNATELIQDTIHRLVPNSSIILFGSRARKDHDIDSDYDLLIVGQYEMPIREKRVLKALIRKELAKHKIPADIFIQSEDEIAKKKEIPGHILRQILKEGVSL